MKPCHRLIAITVMILSAIPPVLSQTPVAPKKRAFKPTSKIEFELSYLAQYESNIYHAYYDTSETSAMLSGIGSAFTWKYRPSRSLSHRIGAYVDLGLYTPSKYSNRNISTIGVVYEPTIHFSRDSRLSPSVDISLRDKDVIDETSTSPVRTLKKWEYDLGLTYWHDIGASKLQASVSYANHNYDESDTTLTSGATQHLTSWDYKTYGVDGGAKFPLGRVLTFKADLGWEKRDYKERKTYTVQYGAFVGRPFAIRSYREVVISSALEVGLGEKSDIEPRITYTRRKDTFENFYGYTQWGYGLAGDFSVSARLRIKASLEYKNKDYPNYWNSRIGRSRREAIDYADFSLEPSYHWSEVVSLIGYMRNYNKVSNDPIYDYHDLTGGVGFVLAL